MTHVTVFVFTFLCFYSCEAQSEYEQEVLDAHNRYREIHNAPAMRLNTEMSAEAAEWAEHMASTGVVDPSNRADRIGEGESILEVCGMTPASIVEESTTLWYKEVCHYDFSKHQSTDIRPVGHFTQLVWKTSQELGVGVATSSNEDCTYVVARYKPNGNTHGHADENVLKGTFDESFCNNSDGRASKAGNAVQNDGSGSGSGNGEGSGSFGRGKKWRRIERGNRWKPFWGSASGQGSGSGGSGDAEKNRK